MSAQQLPVAAMPWPDGWAFDMHDGGAPVVPAPTPAPAPAPAGGEKKTFGTVDEAVQELERRAQERRANRKAEKAERDEEVAAKRKKAAAQLRGMEAELDQDEEDDAPGGKPKGTEPLEGDEDDVDQAKRKKAAKAAKNSDADDDGDEADDDGDHDDSDDADDDVPADDEDDDGDGDEDDDGDEKSLKKAEKLKVGDTEVEIPKGTPKAAVEAIKSLQHRLIADHTRKTQEVAQARNMLTQRAQQTDQMVNQALHAQQVIVQMAQQMIGQPPPLELAQHDIQQYTIQKALYEQRVAQLQGLGGQTQQLRAAQEQQQQQHRAQVMQQEMQHMVRFMPALAKPEARQRFMTEASAVAARSGFSPQDVAAVADHRMLHLLGRLIQAENQLAAYGKAGDSTKARLRNTPPRVKSSDTSQASQGKGANAARAKQEFMRSKRSLQDLRRYINATSS
jgi:hypothetical protein